VQVDPIRPVLKAPGPILLKPGCDGPLSNVAFKFNLRRYIKKGDMTKSPPQPGSVAVFNGSFEVGRCKLNPG